MNQVTEICGIPVCYSEFHTGSAEARGFFWNRYILIGPHFMRDGHRVQRAVLLHEAKHCQAWHLEKRIACLIAIAAPLAFLPLRIVAVALAVGALYFAAAAFARKNELDADAFVVAEGYGVDLLEWLKRQMPRDSEFYPTFEKRCSRITEGMKEKRNAAAA